MGRRDDPPASEQQPGEATEELELFREPEPETDEPVSRTERDTLEGQPSVPPPGFKPGPRPQRILAVSGAKGGVGKTLLTTNLALYLATIGRRVLLVDADAEGANVHTFLGMNRSGGVVPYVPPVPSFGAAASVSASPFASGATTTEERGPGELEPVDTSVPGLSLLHAGVDEPAYGKTRRLGRKRLRSELRELDAEYVVVDLGAGTERSLLDFWLAADLSLFVGVPEPTAIENTYRFVRAAFARHLCASAPDAATRRTLFARLRELGRTPAPLDLARRLESEGDELSSLVRSAMESFGFRMVLNQTRLRADLELGDRMESAARRRLGVDLDYLGYIDYDDTAWSCVRMRRPLLVESPGTKASRNIEKIARRLLAIDSGKGPSRPLRTVPPETHHDLLEVDRGATEEEIRRAYKRAKEIYAPEALCCYGLFDQAGLEALRARLDEAYDVLLDPARRRPYELSVFPRDPPLEEQRPAPETNPEPKPPPPTITPDTEFTGSLIRAVRESQGAEVRDISQRTKIAPTYLKAIEDDDFEGLPAAVYVRGFVTEFAKFLGLDPEQVARTYVRRYQRHFEEQGK